MDPDPFKSYLVEVLSMYQRSPVLGQIPRYDGPSDSQTEEILHSLEKLAQRAWGVAEHHVTGEGGNAGLTNDDVSSPVVPFDPLDDDKLGQNASVEEQFKLLKADISDVARVCNAISQGDLTQKITVPMQSKIMEQIKEVINSMVDNLGRVAEEVMVVVSQHIHTEGGFSGGDQLPNMHGTWREVTGAINSLNTQLRWQTKSIYLVAKALAHGDLSKRIEVEGAKGDMLALKNTVNAMVVRQRKISSEINRVTTEYVTDGKLGGQVQAPLDAGGCWLDLVRNVNKMASATTTQLRAVTEVARAVAVGYLDQHINIDSPGEISDMGVAINTMVDVMNSVVGEVSRVSAEAGREGFLGNRASTPTAQGMWRTLSDNVNVLVTSFTNEVRSVTEVVKAVTYGDLTQWIELDARGEVLELADAVNYMSSFLHSLIGETKRVAIEVGKEGRLGGGVQVQYPDPQGAWKEMSDAVNAMVQTVHLRTPSL